MDFRNRNIAFLSDLHAPYHHKDALAFIQAAKDKYDLEVAVSVGDIADNHYPSYHELEPGTYDGETELRLARKFMQELEEVYPELIITEGNHDALPLRKAKTARIPEQHIRNYNEVFGVQDWAWVRDAYIRTDAGMVLVTHTVGSNARTNASRFSFSSVQGHHHSEYGLHYYADNANLRWHMGTGCLIDLGSPAFNYGSRAVLKRPIVGMGAIIEGAPRLIPMVLTGRGRWNGRV
jgi:hypothetical protein